MLSWDRAMSHQGWGLDEAFHSTETLGQDKKLEGGEKLVGLLEVSLDVDAHHATTSVQVRVCLVLLGKSVVRVRFQTWMNHLFDFGVFFEVLSDDESIVCSLLSSNLKSFRASES